MKKIRIALALMLAFSILLFTSACNKTENPAVNSGEPPAMIESPAVESETADDNDDLETKVKINGNSEVLEVGSSKSVKESDFPVKFYPGATVQEGNKSVVSLPGQRKIDNMVVVLKSNESAEKIRDFYTVQIKNPVVIEDDGNITISSAPGDIEKGMKKIIITIQQGENSIEQTITIVVQEL